MQFPSARTFLFALAILFSASLLPQTHAQSVWNTASDGDWSNATNWSLGVPNGAAVDAEINATGAPFLVTGDIDVTLNLLTLDSTDATLLLTSRNWTLNDKIQIDTGTLQLRGNTGVTGSIVNSGGIIRILGASNGGHASVSIESLANNGTLILDSINGTWSSNLTGEITNNGLIDVQIGAGGDRTFTGTIHNNGDVLVDQRFDINGASVWNQNSGTITGNAQFAIKTGTMNIDGGTLNGQVAVDDGTINILNTSSATGAVQAQGSTQLAGTINDGLEITVQGSSNGGHATGTTQAGFVNQGVLALESINSTWRSYFDATLGFTNGVNGTFVVRTGDGGARDIFGDIVNQGIIDGTDAAYRQTSGSLALASGQLIGEVKAFDTLVNTTGSTTGEIKLHGNANTLSGTINSGLTVRVRGAGDGGHATTAVGSSLTNNGTLILDSINSTWGSTLTGTMTNNGLIDSQVGTGGGGDRTFIGTMNNNGDVLVDQRLNVNGASVWNQNSGTITGNALFVVKTGTINIDGGALNGQVVVDDGTINVLGTSTATGAVQARGNTQLTGTINNGLTVRVRGASDGGHATTTVGGSLTNNGTLILDSINSTWSSNLVGTVTNNGLIDVQIGAGGPRSYTGSMNNNGDVLVDQRLNVNGAGIWNQNSGTITGNALFAFNTGTMNIDGGNLSGQVVVNDGTINILNTSSATGGVQSQGNTQLTGTINNGLEVTVQGSSNGGHANATTVGTLNNAGRLVFESRDSSWGSNLSGSILNTATGVVEVNLGTGGSRNLGFTLDNDGEFLFRANANLGVSGSAHENRGTLTLESARLDLVGDTFENSDLLDGFGIFDLNNSVAFNNTGLVDAHDGTLQILGNFTNFDAGTNTLTGGSYRAQAAATLKFTNADINTNQAEIILDGIDSAIVNQSNVDALADLSINDTGAALRIVGGRDFTTTADLTNRGEIELGGGVFDANSIDNTASGSIVGFGTVTPRPNNLGAIQATGGTLALAAGVHGLGTLEATGGSTLDISAATNDSNTRQLTLRNTGTLALGNKNISVVHDYFNENAGTGNAFDPRNGVTGSGSVNSGVSKTQTLSGDVTGGSTATPLLALGAVRIGVAGQNTTTGSFSINNHAGGPLLRGAIKSSGNGANLAGESQLSITGGPRNFGPIAASGHSEDFEIAFTGATPGSVSRKVALVNNFDNIAGQLVTVTAEAFQPAVPNITPDPISLGDFHVGATAQQAITIANNAPAGAFSESLVANATAAGASVSITGGPSVTVAAGGSNSSIGVAVNTSVAGAKNGQANIARSSTGATGLADLNLGTQSIPVSASVYRFAQPTILTAQPIDFGIVHVGDTISPVGVAIKNNASADGFSERLDASFTGSSAGLLTSGSVNNLAAASSNSAMTLSLDTTTAGVLDGQATVAFVSDGSGVNTLGQTSLGTTDVQVTATVNNFANPALSQVSGDGSLVSTGINEFTLDFGVLDLNASGLTADFNLLNDVVGPADTLAGTWSLTAADFSLSGFNSFNNIAAENALGALQIGFSSATPGAFSGSLILSPRSENASGFSGSLDDITLLVQGIVASPADFNEDGSVDGSDLTQWKGDFGVNADSDADNDLDSDGGDFLAWQRQFTGNASPITTSTGVPEPSSVLLGAIACVGVFLRRNR